MCGVLQGPAGAAKDGEDDSDWEDADSDADSDFEGGGSGKVGIIPRRCCASRISHPSSAVITGCSVHKFAGWHVG